MGIFGGDADMAPPARIVTGGQVRRLRHRQPAMADVEVDGGVQLRIVEFGEHVGADDAELRGAVRDEGGDVEGAYADQFDARILRAEAQRAALFVAERGFGHHPGGGEQRQRLGQDAPLGHRDDDGRGRRRRLGHGPALYGRGKQRAMMR